MGQGSRVFGLCFCRRRNASRLASWRSKLPPALPGGVASQTEKSAGVAMRYPSDLAVEEEKENDIEEVEQVRVWGSGFEGTSNPEQRCPQAGRHTDYQGSKGRRASAIRADYPYADRHSLT
jgi:hypothetical protein